MAGAMLLQRTSLEKDAPVVPRDHEPPERRPDTVTRRPHRHRAAGRRGRLLDIPVHDHVIIGRGRYVSFAEAGLL